MYHAIDPRSFLIHFLNVPKSLILILGQWEYGASSSDPNGALKETIIARKVNINILESGMVWFL